MFLLLVHLDKLSLRSWAVDQELDLELEAQIDILADNKKNIKNILKLAQTLSTQLFQMVHTQRQLGDALC